MIAGDKKSETNFSPLYKLAWWLYVTCKHPLVTLSSLYKESWVPKNWCFWTMVLEKTLESPLDCKEIQPVHSEGDHPECSLQGLMLKLKLQYVGHLMQRTDSFKRPWCWERVKVGGKGDNRGWDGWTASLTQWTWVWVNSGSWWWIGRPGVLQSMRSQRVRHNWVTELNLLLVIFNTVQMLCK